MYKKLIFKTKLMYKYFLFFVFTFNLCSQSKATVKESKCNGNWDNYSVWKNGIPNNYDTIIINNYVVLTSYIELNNNVLIVNSNSELYVDYSFVVNSGSKILNNGRMITLGLKNYGSVVNHGKFIITKSYAYFDLPTCTPVVIQLNNDSLFSNIQGTEYDWQVNGKSLGTNLRTIKPELSGYYKVRLKTYLGDSFGSYSDSINIITTNLSIEQMSSNDLENIYPNPANDYLTFTNIDKDKNNYYEIITLQGQILLKGELNYNNGIISLQNLKSNIYILKTWNNSKVSLIRFCKI